MEQRNIVADLHNHSTASDGEYTPAELVNKAKELGLKALGLTDHDNIAGLDEAREACSKSGVRFVPGVEVSIRFKRSLFVGSLHVILYFSDDLLANEAFRSDLNNILNQGRGPSLVNARVDAINSEFGPEGRKPVLKRSLTTEEVSSYSPNVTRRHFAMALKEKHGIEDKDQINKIIGNDSPAYVPSGIEMSTLKPFLNKYSVVSVLAHPAAGSFPEESVYREVNPPLEIVEKLLPEFIDPELLGIDGLEIYYPGHTPEHCQLLATWAERYNLIVTGGSDCHDEEQRPLGMCGINQSEFDMFCKKIDATS